MSLHDSLNHEELLVRLLTEKEDPAEALSGSELATCETCKERVQEHLDSVHRLEALGRDERRAIESALQAEDMPEGKAEASLRELIRPQASVGEGRRPWIVRALGAAAAVVLVVLFAVWLRTPDRQSTLLGDDVIIEGPRGTVTSFDRFSWSYDGPQAGWYRVLVYRVSDDGGRELVTTEDRIRETNWIPETEEKARWGQRIYWTVEAYQGTAAGDLIDAASERAELSSH